MGNIGKGDLSNGYRIEITCRHLELTPPIRLYIEEHMKRVEKLVPPIIDVHIRLEVHRLEQSVDIVFHFSHFKVKVGAVTEDLYSAIDKAFDRLTRKLKRWKSRIQDHHAQGISRTEMEVSILEQSHDLPEEWDREIVEANNRGVKEAGLPRVVKKKRRALKELTLAEAVLDMDLSGDHFLLYRCADDRALKLLYRRRDESYGLITID